MKIAHNTTLTCSLIKQSGLRSPDKDALDVSAITSEANSIRYENQNESDMSVFELHCKSKEPICMAHSQNTGSNEHSEDKIVKLCFTVI